MYLSVHGYVTSIQTTSQDILDSGKKHKSGPLPKFFDDINQISCLVTQNYEIFFVLWVTYVYILLINKVRVVYNFFFPIDPF